MLIFLDPLILLCKQMIFISTSAKLLTLCLHSILLNTLWSIGITGALWTYFKTICQIITKESLLLSFTACSFRCAMDSILGPLLFLVYINGMSSYVHHRHFLKFIDDHKRVLHISTPSDYSALQEDITALFTWSRDSDLDFNLKKFVHLSFKSKLDTTFISATFHLLVACYLQVTQIHMHI